MLFPIVRSTNFPHRVVITGAGIVTSLGQGWAVNAEGFRAGRRRFCPVSQFDVSRQRVRVAAEVQLPAQLPDSRLSARQMARMDRAARILFLAAREAWDQSGWVSSGNLPFVLGTTAGGMSLGELYFRTALESASCRAGQASRAVHYQPQVQARTVAEALGFSGPVTIVSTACAAGSNAIGIGWEMVRNGLAERVMAGGYDALSQMVFAGFDALQALSPTTCRPFDCHRDGLALGEGAGVLALETLEAAQRRGAPILAEITGYSTSLDHHHLTQPHPQGETALKVMREACQVAGVTPEEIDYINAHGTGTALNDAAEAQAISSWAGARVSTLPVSSTKAGVGHMLGAAGAVEAVICAMALSGQWLPPQAALETPDPAALFPIVRTPTDAPLRSVLSNSFGFGGVNATLILRRHA